MSEIFTPEKILSIGGILNDTSRPIGQRFRALFALKNITGSDSIDQISRCLLNDESALIKHECAYCLGQIQDNYAIPVLNQVLSNTSEHPMVRHEAAEALGAIGAQQSLAILKKYLNDSNESVSETCLLAIRRIEYILDVTNDDMCQQNVVNDCVFKSVDPVPHINSSEDNVSKLESDLIDPKNDLFARYQAMFALRNINSNESAIALTKGLRCEDSALFRHEIAYVLGQMQNPLTVEPLVQVLQDMNENEMVRHECAEALGAIASEDAQQVLNKYIEDPQRVVRESVEVALDMSEYNNSKDFQYFKN